MVFPTGTLEQTDIKYPEPWRGEYVVVITLLAILVLFGLMITAVMYRKSLKPSLSNSITITNQMIDGSDEKQPPRNDTQQRPSDDVDLATCHKLSSGNGVEEASILPEWLLKRKEMIYSHIYVEQQEKLGSGQFGTVFKGRLKQGNAVYAKFLKRKIDNRII